MTTPLHNQVRLRDPGELIAALPHLLGFHPIDSLVLVTLKDPAMRRVGLTMRGDLPPPEHQLAAAEQFLVPLRQHGATGAVLVVVGGRAADRAGILPHRDLVELMDAALTGIGVPLLHAAWTSVTGRGAPWCCYDHGDCAGQLPDPSSSPLAAVTAMSGAVTFETRERLAGLLTPDDPVALDRRANRLSGVTEAANPDRQSTHPGGAHRDLLAVRETIDHARGGRLVLGDEEIVRLAIALTDHRVRDACLATAGSERSSAAEQVWLALTRATPVPHRAEPATLLAFSAYLRGDGALAGMALDLALLAQPAHCLAGLLRQALNGGIPPVELAALTRTGADLAERLLEGEERW